MGEKVQVAAKKPEVKRENLAYHIKNADQSQSMSSPADQVLYLQRTIGNQAVQRLIKSGALQAKLRIGQLGDMYEQEVSKKRVEPSVGPKTAPEMQTTAKKAPKAPTKKEIAGSPLGAGWEKLSVFTLEEENEEKKSKKEPLTKEKEGIGAGEKTAEVAPEKPEAVSISTEDPGQIIEYLKNVTAASSVASYDEAQKVSAEALENQKQQVEQNLPEIPAPTGLPAKKTRSKEKGKLVAPAEKPPSAFEGEKSGKEGEEYKPQVEEAPPPPPVKPTVLGGGEADESGKGDTELSRSAQNELKNVHMDTRNISTNAGERPAVDMTGEADPSQLDSFRGESRTKVQNAKTEASKEINQDFGENDIFPEPTNETLKASKALSSPKKPSGKGDEALSIPSEAIAGLNESLGPVLRERIGKQKEKYDSGKEKFDSDSAKAKVDADKQIANLDNETREKQIEEQNNAKAKVAQSRAEWQIELDSVEQDYQKKASKATEEQREKIAKEKQKGEDKAVEHLEDAEKKAEQEKLKAEKEADQKEKDAKKESKGFWGWVKSAASAVIDGLKKAVNFIYDGLRKAVKLIFEAAKALVKAAIELARMAIVGLIKGLGLILKGLVTVVFAAFPNIAKKINSKIDKGVNVAVDAVNTAADYLKKGVEAVLDFLANTLDKLLGLIQSIYNGIFTVIGMIIRGEFKELMERIGSLVDAAKAMASLLEGSVWGQLLGIDISKPMPGEVGPVALGKTTGELTAPRKYTAESDLTEADVAVEPVATELLEPELIEDLDLRDGEEKIIGERSGDAYSVAGILADFREAEPGVASATTPEHTMESVIGPTRTPVPTMGRAERAAKVWDQMKTFMGKWLSENWGKLLLAVIGALVGIIAANIITGGAILAALPVIMKIVTAVFVGLAIMKAMGYLRTYLSEGWEKNVQPAAKALANAIAVGIVELAMALGFRAIGVGLKAVGKAVKAGAKVVVKGVKRGATATAAGIKSLLKSGAKLVSRSGTAFIRSGKLIFKGLKSGFLKGAKKVKDLVSRLFAKFRFRKFKIVRKGNRIRFLGYINPWVVFYDGELMEVRGERGGGRLKKYERVEVKIPGRRTRTGIVLKNKEMAEQLSKLSDAQRIKAYENLRDIKRLHPTKKFEIHHIATNKNFKWRKKWSKTFENLFNKGGLKLDDDINKILLPSHAGPHPDKYHQWVLERLTNATKRLRKPESIRSALENELTAIAKDFRKNPKLLWP